MKKQVFQNEEEFQKIYDECLERMPNAGKTITDSYKEMCEANENYIVAIQEHMFRCAYQFGYEAAVEAFSREPAEHEQSGTKAIPIVQVFAL